MINFFETPDFQGTLETLYREYTIETQSRTVKTTTYLKPEARQKGEYLLSV